MPAAGAAPTAQPSQSCGTPRPRRLLFAPPAPQAGEWKPAAGHGQTALGTHRGFSAINGARIQGIWPEAAEASGTQRPTLRRGGTGGRHCAAGEGEGLLARNAAKGALRPLAPGNGTVMHRPGLATGTHRPRFQSSVMTRPGFPERISHIPGLPCFAFSFRAAGHCFLMYALS